MIALTGPEKIAPGHRDRGAVVYVRQSTPRQLHHSHLVQSTSHGHCPRHRQSKLRPCSQTGVFQRRFLDVMSPYARQFVEQLEKPDVDRITGLPPSVAIEQRVTRGGGKSTVFDSPVLSVKGVATGGDPLKPQFVVESLRANTPELPAARQCRVSSLSRFLSLGSRPPLARPGQGAASARTARSGVRVVYRGV